MGRELTMVGVGQIAAAVGGVVGVRLMTSILSPDIYGELALAFTFVALSQQLLFGPFSGSLMRFFPSAHDKEEFPGFFTSMVTLTSKITIVIVAISLIGAGVLWIIDKSDYVGLAIFTLLFTIFLGYNALFDSIQTAARHRVIVAWHQVVGQWLRYLAAAGLVLLLGKNPTSAMAGYALSAVVVFGSQLFLFRKKLPTNLVNIAHSDTDWSTKMINYSAPFIFWGIFTWLQISSDRWALESFSNTQSVGLYTALYQLGYYPLTMLTSVFVQYVTPILFHQAGDGTDPMRINLAQYNIRRILVGALCITTLVVIISAIFHHTIFGLLVASEYRSVSFLLPFMVLSGGMFACGQIVSLGPLNRNEPKKLIIPKIMTGIFGTLINFAGAYWMGLRGVVYASAAFSIIYFLWVFILFRYPYAVRKIEGI